MQFAFGKTPRDFAVLGETSAALLLGAGGQIAEVAVKQFQQCAKHEGSYLFKKTVLRTLIMYKIHKIIDGGKTFPCDSNPRIWRSPYPTFRQTLK